MRGDFLYVLTFRMLRVCGCRIVFVTMNYFWFGFCSTIVYFSFVFSVFFPFMAITFLLFFLPFYSLPYLQQTQFFACQTCYCCLQLILSLQTFSLHSIDYFPYNFYPQIALYVTIHENIEIYCFIYSMVLLLFQSASI